MQQTMPQMQQHQYLMPQQSQYSDINTDPFINMQNNFAARPSQYTLSLINLDYLPITSVYRFVMFAGMDDFAAA